MLIKNAVLRRVETRSRHFHRNGDADRVTNPLPERTGCAFHPRRFTKFRMSWSFRMQLPEPFDFRHRQIVAAQMEPGVKKHTAVTGRKNKVVTINPTRLIGI